MQLEPVIYSDGKEYFNKLESRYEKHSKGLFVMTPSGTGKTYFCDRQPEPHWIDGDVLWFETGAQPPLEYEGWNKGVPVIERVEQRCDVITAAAIDRGFWIMGSVNFWLKPDAIVIPPLELLMERIKKRQESGYDGGLTEEHYEQLKTHIRIITRWNTEHGVPLFKSIEKAVSALTKDT
jgi:hypothetical protein